MTIRKRTGAVALGLMAMLSMGRLPLVAQEPAPQKSADAPAKKRDPNHRVPPYFGQVGLTLEQRSSIYGIQARRHEKIDALERQIKADRAELLAECEGVLTEAQKKLLENLRKAAAESTSKATATPRPAGVSKP